MKLSIIIPVYNVRNYIAGCLESIVRQTCLNNDVEIIMVNDGTPDDSMVIAESFIGRMPNIQVINQNNQGLSAARNSGLALARGLYVWFVDSDDSLLDGAVSSVLEYIETYSGVDVLATMLQLKDELTGRIQAENPQKKLVATGKDYMFADNPCGASQRFIIRKQFLEDNNLRFKHGVYHEDGDFGLRMLYLAKSLVVLESPVYRYLLRSSGSIMSTRKMKMNYDLVDIYHGLEIFCDEKVDEEDKWKFKMKMFECLDCTIQFSRNEINTPEFKAFYREHRELIHDKAGELLRHHDQLSAKQLRRVMHFYFFPLFYTRLKHNVKVLIKKLR